MAGTGAAGWRAGHPSNGGNSEAARAVIVAGKTNMGGGRRMLLWDAPNMDMCLSEVIGERATPATRPDMGAVVSWLRDRCEPGDVLEAAVFANVARGFEGAMAGWVASLRHLGWAVFVKPKQHRRDDVDIEMARHLERRFNQGRLGEVVLASHDAKAFAEPLARLARAGVSVVVLGFRERASFAAEHPDLIFIDVEDVPGAFARPLPRTNLFDLPSAGRWFAPFVDVQPAPAPGPGAGTATEPAPTGTAAPGAAEDPPSRADVVHLVISEVETIAGTGAAGLLLQHAGELLRDHFPGFSLEDAGFRSHTDLLDELLATREVAVERTDAGALLLRPAVIDLSDPPAQAEADVRPSELPAAGSGGPGEDVTLVGAPSSAPTAAAPAAPGAGPPADPPVQPSAAVEPAAAEPSAADEPVAAEPAAAERSMTRPSAEEPETDQPAADEPAAGGPAADEASADEPTVDDGVGVANGPADRGGNAIYRAFGYEPPGPAET
jgi:uncharacterized protein